MDSRDSRDSIKKDENNFYLLNMLGRERRLAASKKIINSSSNNITATINDTIICNNPVDDVWIKLFFLINKNVHKFCVVCKHFNDLINKNVKYIVDKNLYEKECCSGDLTNLIANQKEIIALFKRRLFYLVHHPLDPPKWPTSFKDLKIKHFSTIIESYRCVIRYIAEKNCYNNQIIEEYIQICNTIKYTDLAANVIMIKENEKLINYIKLFSFTKKFDLRYKLESISPPKKY